MSRYLGLSVAKGTFFAVPPEWTLGQDLVLGSRRDRESVLDRRDIGAPGTGGRRRVSPTRSESVVAARSGHVL